MRKPFEKEFAEQLEADHWAAMNDPRNVEICRLRDGGMKLEAIAYRFRISRQRVHQIYARYKKEKQKAADPLLGERL